jgi:hypothetical protein
MRSEDIERTDLGACARSHREGRSALPRIPLHLGASERNDSLMLARDGGKPRGVLVFLRLELKLNIFRVFRALGISATNCKGYSSQRPLLELEMEGFLA